MKKKKSFTAVMCVLFALGSSQLFAAEAGGFYIGADAGATGFSGDGPAKDSIFAPGQTFEDSATSYGLHVGFQFNDWFAAELGYTDFGKATDRFIIRPDIMFIVAPRDTQTLDAKGVTVNGVFSYQFTQRFSVLGVVGVSSVDYKNAMTGGFSEVTGHLQEKHSFADQGLVYGVGARYALDDALSLRVDFRRNDIGDFTLDTGSIGLEYAF